MLIWTPEEAIRADERFKNKTKDEVTVGKITSPEYQGYGFKLTLIGSDGVVKAYDNLMQLFYSLKVLDNLTDEQKKAQNEQLLWHLGDLLLEIRKSVGNKNTALHPFEMLEWKINDIRKYQEEKWGRMRYPRSI